MKITSENSHLFVALQVLDKIKADKHSSIDAYCNGREQGLSVLSFGETTRQVAFSEYRNSDDIVVYFGEHRDFDMQGNVPSEKVYEGKKFFRYDDYAGAAKFISNYLKGK